LDRRRKVVGLAVAGTIVGLDVARLTVKSYILCLF
jgi:hypothetical protein